MKILAIETSCEYASVALYLDGEIAERMLSGHANHSERLLPAVAGLLSEAGVSLRSLDALAFGAGPGAFTGLRLSCGVVQGLATGAGIGVVPVCSLDALALQGSGERLYAVTDARMGEVYCATYRRQGDVLQPVSAPRCCPPEELLPPEGGDWYGLGSGFAAYPQRLQASLLSTLSGIDATAVPRAAEVARLAARAAMDGELVAPERAAPLYVRDKVALTTVERLARGGKA